MESKDFIFPSFYVSAQKWINLHILFSILFICINNLNLIFFLTISMFLLIKKMMMMMEKLLYT